jgi:hypothetical protein
MSNKKLTDIDGEIVKAEWRSSLAENTKWNRYHENDGYY